MGTSRNDPSPRTKPWLMATAMLGRKEIDARRLNEQLWRAAADDLGGALADLFSDPALARASEIASSRYAVQDALAAYDAAVREYRSAGLSIDMGRRALARISAAGGDSQTFASQLFSEATLYYVSRDLPSVVGTAGRVSSASEMIDYKTRLRNTSAEVVNAAGPPPSAASDWAGYISSVISRLQGAA